MHHTKVKADIGLTKVISDLMVKGYVPCIPLSEHQPYDLVVMCRDGFDMPSNNQSKFIKWANNYLNIKQESSETIRCTPEMVKT